MAVVIRSDGAVSTERSRLSQSRLRPVTFSGELSTRSREAVSLRDMWGYKGRTTTLATQHSECPIRASRR